MSVIVKGMKMPENGAVLVVKHEDDGKVYIKYVGVMGYSMELVELPEKHGRLIDGDELADGCDDPHWCRWLSEIEDMPTIVEAEGD